MTETIASQRLTNKKAAGSCDTGRHELHEFPHIDGRHARAHQNQMTRTGPCLATALLSSGLPDPQWKVPSETALKLERLWQQLAPSQATPPQLPAQGYRGCTFNCGPRGRWFAYGGVVVAGDTRRDDPDRTFERALLQSAPRGLLPADLLRGLA